MYDEHENKEPEIHGMIAEFADPDAVLSATKNAYREGYRDMEAYSPFPIHGLAEALGFTHTWVPFCTMVMGFTGATFGFLLQVVACVYHFPYDIGGRPNFSWPAFIPITFEMMVLFAAFTAGLSMLAMNGLPLPYHSIFNAENFERATSDRFFLCVEATDPRYDAKKTKKFLEGLDTKPENVSEVPA